MKKTLVILMDPIRVDTRHARGARRGKHQVGQQTEEQGRMWTGVLIVMPWEETGETG